jgi:uncharacterized protein with HEPN domain
MRNTRYFLEDMRDALLKMIEVTRGVQIDNFSENWILISAVRDQVMILGEAVKHVPSIIVEQYPTVPWSQLVKTRDKLIHGYFKTDPYLLYQMATVRAEKLLPIIDKIIVDHQKSDSDEKEN